MRKHSIPNFIKKAWDMLEQEYNWSIISWNQEGTSIIIQDQLLFAQALLPRYFKHSNIASFIRQLNMYNFHKRKTDLGRTQFFHKLFRKNHRELLIGIKRKPSQAEINQAEQLIRQLAPECLEDNSTDVRATIQHQQTHQYPYMSDLQYGYYPESSQIWYFSPLVVPNMYQDYQWQPEKIITNNIIIQGVADTGVPNQNYQVTF